MRLILESVQNLMKIRRMRYDNIQVMETLNFIENISNKLVKVDWAHAF